MGIYDELARLDEQSPPSQEPQAVGEAEQAYTQKATQKSAQARETPRSRLSGKSREQARREPRVLPTRDEIQEFSFRLRDELKVKVQAEVPHGWQKELEEVARQLDVKKLELYRFILGEFLGKVRRKRAA